MGIAIDSRRLRVFVEVVRQGGFSRAAAHLHATQPTVSKAVQQLESELRVRLLDRIGRRVTLTAAGELVYRRAVPLLAQGDDLVAELAEVRGLKSGVLRVGFPRLGASALFARMFALFRRRYPAIEVTVGVHSGQKMRELLRSGELDVGVLGNPIEADFEQQEIRTEPLMVLLPREHPAAARPAVMLSRLAGIPAIMPDQDSVLHKVLSAAYERAGITPRVATCCHDADLMFELVAAGLGIAFLPRVLAHQHRHRAVRSVALKDSACQWSIAFCWRRGAHVSAAAQAWLTHAHEQARSAA
jgi:DNA-binding transcriptional LysR family regulator